MLVYVPNCRSLTILTEIDIANNYFNHTEHIKYDHLTTYKESINELTDFKLLRHIALFSLKDNFPQLKRQDIPSSTMGIF